MNRKYFKSAEFGVAMVEFAIILPLLILILFGIIDFGLLMYNKQVITNASREGARVKAMGNDPAPVVIAYCQDRLITFGSSSLPSTVLNSEGVYVTITVSFDYDPLVLPIADTNLIAATTMREN